MNKFDKLLETPITELFGVSSDWVCPYCGKLKINSFLICDGCNITHYEKPIKPLTLIDGFIVANNRNFQTNQEFTVNTFIAYFIPYFRKENICHKDFKIYVDKKINNTKK